MRFVSFVTLNRIVSVGRPYVLYVVVFVARISALHGLLNCFEPG